ncbi:MAG: long-chain fatty acid--CoA ligase [Myxococcota bacterium]
MAAEPLSQLFLQRAQSFADRPAYHQRIDERWRPTTWRSVRQRVEDIALGLVTLGAGPRISVAIMCSTRPEWALVDMANLCIGAITVGLYPNQTVDQAVPLIQKSDAQIVIVEDNHKRTILEQVSSRLDRPLVIVTLESSEPSCSDASVLTFADLEQRGAARRAAHPEEFERRVAERTSSEVASYIFTSGTTGSPKGAVIDHRNFSYVIRATNALVPYRGERALIFLPMAQPFQRYISYLNLMVDAELYYGGPLSRLEADLAEVRPTCFGAIPRLLEQIQRRVIARGKGRGGLIRAGFDRAVAAMHEAAQQLRAGYEPGIRGRLQARLADRVVGRGIRQQLGGRVRFIGVGGSTLGRDIHAFFEDVGLPVLTGYGTTETCSPACMNTLNNRRIGSAGRPLPGTEVRVDEDGEILVRGPGVCRGYVRDEAATGRAFTDDGWFRTGDVGTMSRDGFLAITDRKQNMIRTAEGARVAPQPLEQALRRHPWIEQAVVVGQGRPHLGALFSLDPDIVPDVAAQIGLAPTVDVAELARHPTVMHSLREHLSSFNANQPEEQRIHCFSVLDDRLSTTTGELTPTDKIKRHIVFERRGSAIERMYRS